MPFRGKCKIADCEQQHYSHGYCKVHYPFEELFWARVGRKGPDECWEWQAARQPRSGYGSLRVNKKHKIAHRVAWELVFGMIPDGLLVCHKCDNPPCCNPNHLFLGTPADNMRDCAQKGRKESLVTNSQVVDIRRMYLCDNIRQKEIGHHFGIDHATVSDIVRGAKRQYVDYNPINPKCHARTKISDAQIPKVFSLRREGFLHREIADRYGVHQSEISKILSGKVRRVFV